VIVIYIATVHVRSRRLLVTDLAIIKLCSRPLFGPTRSFKKGYHMAARRYETILSSPSEKFVKIKNLYQD
jgi:hypothetical protein